jgi:hypothetical protein
MPSEIRMVLSCGSGPNARLRKKLYRKAAKDGNLSGFIIRLLDKAIGIKLPLPVRGRPRKSNNKIT